MRIIKQFRLVALAAALFFSANLTAQHHGHDSFHGVNIEHLNEILNLTEGQVTQLEAIREKYKVEFEALHESEMDDHKEKRMAARKLMKAQHEDMLEVLTEEQRTILQQKREVHKEKRHERMQKVDHEALKAEMKAFHEEEVMPVMLEQRQKLEEQISEEDKATLALLRTDLKGHHKHFKQKRHKPHGHHKKGDDTSSKPKNPEIEKRKESMKTLHGLVQKYDEAITSLLEEIAPQRESWKEKMKEIHEKYVPKPEEGQPAEGMHQRRHHKKHHEKDGMHKGAFLLMDPNNPDLEVLETEAVGAHTKVSIFPNPATTINTITYEVLEAGQVRIELHSETGNILKVIIDDYREAGEYSVEVDLSNLQDGLYYYSITDKQGISTKTVVVSKQ